MEQAVVGNPALSFDVMNALSKHGGRCGSISLLRSPVSLFDRICFAHVFALFSLGVKTRAFLVINMCLGVDPHEAVSTAWRRVAPTLAPALVFVELTVVAGAAEGDGLTNS